MDDYESKGSIELRALCQAKAKELGMSGVAVRINSFRKEESINFLRTGKMPEAADAAEKSAWIDALPLGHCAVCGKDIKGKKGYIVKNGENVKVYCEEHAPCNANAEVCEAPAPETSDDPVAAAIANLQAALAKKKSEPKVAPVDEGKIAEVAAAGAKVAAKAAAEECFRNILHSAVASIPPPTSTTSKGKRSRKSASKAGVDVVKSATSWSAKADKTKIQAIDKLKRFLSEFSMWKDGCSARFVNTFAATVESERTNYVLSYAEVGKEERFSDLKEKVKSPEWSEVLKAFKPFGKTSNLNVRLAVFFGDPGGGKTWQAIEACKSINGDGETEVMGCHFGMDPATLLFEYKMDYETGKKGFVPSALFNAITEGRAVVLDEINLLPTESVMFLQNLTDNKKSVYLMGENIMINDGFFVVGTMNLETGLGMTPLPPALTDRCAVIKKFSMTNSQLAVASCIE